MSRYWLMIPFAASAWLGPWLGGPYAYLTPAFAFGLIPLGDRLLRGRVPARSSSSGARTSDGLLYLYAAFHCWLIPWACLRFAGAPLDDAGLLLSVSLVSGGLGITIAHELIHRRSRLERAIGELLLVFVCYGHFAVEHVFGHHLNVATPRDPVSAPRGVSLYRYYPRAVLGSFASAWRLRPGRVLRTTLASVAVAAALGGWGGPRALAFFLLQSLIAFSLLEGIDYVEHYGLRRREISPGRYEPVGPNHSWDSQGFLTDSILINLQRHSDHHLHPLKAFPMLEPQPRAPQLPYSYPLMILVALVPPLWRRMMDPRLGS